jgi:large subunit ribosomal protein L25
MKAIELKGTLRSSLGKTSSKQIRKNNHVPCVLYGGKENVHFSTYENEFQHLVYTPEVKLVNLNIEGKIYKAILQDIQFHPVTDKILHVDFYQIYDDKVVDIKIPVHMTGFAEGVKQGGKLTLQNRRIRVKALPKDLPDFVEIDVTKLTLGKSIKISDLSFENLTLLDPKNMVVVTIKLTRASRGMAASSEEGA